MNPEASLFTECLHGFFLLQFLLWLPWGWTSTWKGSWIKPFLSPICFWSLSRQAADTEQEHWLWYGSVFKHFLSFPSDALAQYPSLFLQMKDYQSQQVGGGEWIPTCRLGVGLSPRMRPFLDSQSLLDWGWFFQTESQCSSVFPWFEEEGIVAVLFIFSYGTNRGIYIPIFRDAIW